MKTGKKPVFLFYGRKEKLLDAKGTLVFSSSVFEGGFI